MKVSIKRICALCSVLSIFALLTWQFPLVIDGSANLAVVYYFFVIALSSAFVALVLEFRDQSTLQKELKSTKEELAEIKESQIELKESLAKTQVSVRRHSNELIRF